MLKVDLKEGRYEIVQKITEYCSPFGIVNTIRLFLGPDPTAVVEMSTMKDTEVLALTFGGRLVGNTAFIALAQTSVENMQDRVG